MTFESGFLIGFLIPPPYLYVITEFFYLLKKKESQIFEVGVFHEPKYFVLEHVGIFFWPFFFFAEGRRPQKETYTVYDTLAHLIIVDVAGAFGRRAFI